MVSLQANAVLSDEKKRVLYDKYGSFGLYIAEQVGEENMDMVGSIMFLQSKWFKVVANGLSRAHM
jgi:hypothetical protein